MRDRLQVGAVLGLVALLVVLPWSGLDDLAPGAVLGQLRNNNEAYAFLALVLLRVLPESGRPVLPLSAWWSLVVLGVAITQGIGAELGLPQALLTLRESFLAAALLGLHLGPGAAWRRGALPYVLVAVVVVAGEVPVPGWQDSAVADWITTHAESFGFVVLSACYLDLVRPTPASIGPRASTVVHGGWYVVLAALAVAVATRNPGGVDEAVAATDTLAAEIELWLLRNLEALLAALALSAWYDVRAWSRRRGPDPVVRRGA